jgi:hypothetical protein
MIMLVIRGRIKSLANDIWNLVKEVDTIRMLGAAVTKHHSSFSIGKFELVIFKVFIQPSYFNSTVTDGVSKTNKLGSALIIFVGRGRSIKVNSNGLEKGSKEDGFESTLMQGSNLNASGMQGSLLLLLARSWDDNTIKQNEVNGSRSTGAKTADTICTNRGRQFITKFKG